ncbi:helix-turn-helix domain-containing protein [Shewanella sp. 0m-8]
MSKLVKLDGSIVKRLREKCRLTQEELAEKSKMSNRHIQRIEDVDNNGQTKLENAESIAIALGVSLDTLSYSPASKRQAWLVIQQGLPLDLRNEIDSVLREIKLSAMPFESLSRSSTTLYVQSKTLPWSVTIEHHFDGGGEMTWEFRPVHFDEDMGLLWTEPDLLDEMFWEIDVEQLCYETAYDVIIDGKSVVPDNLSALYRIEFFHLNADAQRVYDGYQLIQDDSDLAISLGIWLSERKAKVHASLSSSVPGAVLIESGVQDNISLVISRVWQDDKNQFQRAPWTYKHREEIETSINQRKLDKQGPVHVTYSSPMRYDKTITPMIPALNELNIYQTRN